MIKNWDFKGNGAVELVEGWGHAHFATPGVHLGDKKGILGPYRKNEMEVWLCFPPLSCIFGGENKGFEGFKGIQEHGHVRGWDQRPHLQSGPVLG